MSRVTLYAAMDKRTAGCKPEVLGSRFTEGSVEIQGMCIHAQSGQDSDFFSSVVLNAVWTTPPAILKAPELTY